MDVASVLKKTIERIIGTSIGAALGMGVGYISSAIANGSGGRRGQAAFMGISLFFYFLFVGFCGGPVET